ncbi:single-stranded-DNA-specific exonuclease RecJ [Roseococcus sp. SDR]|uniref:single-stranded-DNA-specific exonuclease RecJ n=1 Tax=Roseococcus sp. SDR TaxID=2835532 RepID=UPI001BCCE85B|nr:single-stranded-DNA-specific exonuclease RecJ [Roseococcus sp. SDR]MBS7788750.1 single-stranded-DNA-specific exonuclease RecJ [Roseococcus sp. SDR]MBV1844064.1 single-stranded-DNA-specific exonuclease RecJ [Roseococcus sp. SDR]
METALGVERSLTGRRWVWRHSEPRLAAALSQQLGLPEITGRLLAARGLDAESAGIFLAPTLRALLPDPSVLLEMDQAAQRLADAVQRAETVAVFADYDVDGACSGAVMTHALRQLGCTVIPYVPDRLAEGYGPNGPAIAGLVAKGATLIICVDCGIAAHEALADAGAEIVVLDHHKAEGPPPRVVAAVNPNRLDCPSGLRQLCAAGVAFLAAVAMQRELRRRGFFAQRAEPDLRELLDMVALATVCDVVPLLGVNRAFVQHGLRILAKRERAGLAALMELNAVRDAPSAHTLGFVLGPRINAGGRISVPDLGLRLLLESDPIEARGMAERLDAVNRKRQEVEAGVLHAAMLQAETQQAAGHAVFLLQDEGWHPGVVGIVAGRVRERFNRPACVAGVEAGKAKGSGRSVPGLDLGAAIIAARQSGMLIAGGGHAMAAGFTCEAQRLPELHAHLDERLAAARDLPSAAEQVLEGALTVRGATAELAESIGRLAPFGAGNDEPAFGIARARVVKAGRVGKEGATIRAFLEGEDGGRLKAICFRAKEGPLAEALLAQGAAPLMLAGHLRAETWNDQTSAGFFVTDAARL